jgi:hypothetical protein
MPPPAATPRELAPVADRGSERPPASAARAPDAARSDGHGDDESIPTGQFEPIDKDSIATGQFDPIDKAVAEGALVKGAPIASELESGPVQERNAESDPPQVIALPLTDARGSAQTREVRDSISSEPDFIATDERRSKSTMAGWALALLVLIAIGFVLGRRDQDSTPPVVEAIGKRVEQPAKSAPALDTPAPFEEATSKRSAPSTAGAKPLAQGEGVVVPRDAGFEIFEGILDKSMSVKPEQALLMVDASAGLPQAELLVDGTKVGPLPAKVPLAEGVHELAIVSGDAVSYRFASVHRGKTWVLHAP